MGERYQIYLKGKPVSIEPNTYWPDRGVAEDMISVKEEEYPRFKGQLEVRRALQPAEQKGERRELSSM